MRIAVIGAGGLGVTLAGRLGEVGHEVSIANSRGAASLAATAAEIGATPASVAAATAAADLVIVSIPTRSVVDLPPARWAHHRDRGRHAGERVGGPTTGAPGGGGGPGDSWRQQTGAPAYCRDLDAAALADALAEADRGRMAEYRAAEEARITRSLATLPTEGDG